MLDTHGNKITFLGHATFKITTSQGNVLIIDPWIMTNPKCPDSHKHLDRVDHILLTHGHGDHLGDLFEVAAKHHPKIVCINETAIWLSSKGVKNVIGMGKGGTYKFGDVAATMVNAIHSNGIQDGHNIIYGGEPAGFVVHLSGGLTLYHAGDTCAFGDMKLIADIYKPGVACLPIGDHYTMGPREAAVATRLLGARHIIPMHYATFPALTGTPEAYREAASDIKDLEIHVMKPGETIG